MEEWFEISVTFEKTSALQKFAYDTTLHFITRNWNLK